MKLTKKILSLVLAAALLLGTVAIAAQAEGLTDLAGSVQTFVITSDKTDENGVTNVKPGETIKIQVYMSTNYYTGSTGGDFFLWTAGVFEDLGSNYATKNFVASFTPNIANPANTKAYPTGYGADDYVGFQNSRINNSGVTKAQVVDNELVYEFNLTVLNDESLVGKENVVFEIPAGSVRTASNTRKGIVYQCISKSSSSLDDGSIYAETVDLSKASLKINIVSAEPEVEYCDYTALTAAVAKAPALAAEFYNTDAYTAWTNAKAAGQVLLDAEKLEKSDENQKKIDDAAALVNSTFAALVPQYLSLAKLNAAVAACAAIDPSDKDYYVAADYEAWEAALADAKAAQADYNETMPATKQAEVDALADALTAAYAKLNAAYVDLTKLNNAVDTCYKPAYAAEYYDATAWANWEAALADAKAAQTSYAGKPATAQATVDGIADALVNAYKALVPSIVDLTDLNKAIAESTTPAYAAEYYNATAWANWEAALAAADTGATTYKDAANTAENQAAVAALAKDLRDAFAALVPAFVDLTDLNNAIAECTTLAYAAEYYNATAWANWEAALAAADTGATTYKDAADTAENQAAVAALAKDLRDAFAALVPAFVDASAIDAAIAAAVPAYAAEYYDAAAYEAFEAALAAAKAADFDGKADTEANRAEVAKVAGNLNDAFAALVPAFVSYANLEAALAAYGAAPEAAAFYTPDSWANYTAALAAANEANSNRPDPLPAATEANQAAVDAYATDLEAAFKALTPAGTCSIISVTALQSNYVKGDVVNFEFLCEGTGFSKIQVITEAGTTATYHRTHSAVKDIRVEGENEIWTIALKVPANEKVTRYAKAKMDRSWDNGVVAFEFNPTVEDAEVKSVEILLNGEAVTEFLNTDVVTVKIVTGPATRRIRIVNPVSGTTATYSSPAEVNVDGTKVWTFTRKYETVKAYDFDIYTAKSNNVLVDSGADLEFSVSKIIVPDLPSTEKVEDAVISASVAKARVRVGATQTFTIATDKYAKAVRLVNANGEVVTKSSVVASEDGTAKTFVISRAYNIEGTYEYTVEALYGNTWIAGEADTAVSFKVIY